MEKIAHIAGYDNLGYNVGIYIVGCPLSYDFCIFSNVLNNDNNILFTTDRYKYNPTREQILKGDCLN